MSEIIALLERPLFTLAGTQVTLGHFVYVPLMILAGILFIRWSAQFLASRMRKRGVNPDLAQVINRAYLILGIAVLVISILDIINIPLTAFAFISGAVAIGIGFGAQNIINNFISGWILMWERPIGIGDFLEIGELRGTVESVNTRSTRIRRTDGVHILIPNSYLLENIVVNWTLIDRLMRTSVRVGVSYGSPVQRVSELMLQAALEHADILDDPIPGVSFEDFGDNSLIFDLFFWIDTSHERDLRRVRSDLRYRIEALFRENEIVIAFPQRDVHIDGAITIKTAQEALEAQQKTVA